MLDRLIEDDDTGHRYSEKHLRRNDAIDLLDEAPAQHIIKLVKTRNQRDVFQRFWVPEHLRSHNNQPTETERSEQ